ncbi:MAG: beta-propeller domain-containing protein [Verrucomicrobiia bacterium]
MRPSQILIAGLMAGGVFYSAPAAQQSAHGVRHAFLATGAETYIVSHTDRIVWRYPLDGWMLPNGNILLVLAHGKNYGGGVVEVTRGGRVQFEYRGKQKTVNTAERTADGRYLIAEGGAKPCVLEVDTQGRTLAKIALQSAAKDPQQQIGAVRKLANGNYLVPQPADKVVREYDAKGKVVWEKKTNGEPFCALRLPKQRTLIACTTGKCILEVDRAGKVTWKLTNQDFQGARMLDLHSGIQRLPNGNLVFATHRPGRATAQLVEVNRAKKTVWTYSQPNRPAIRHFQILNTNGKALRGVPLR